MHYFSILTIGPSFKLNARAIASLDLDIDLAVDIAYKVENTKVFFPPQRGKKSGGIAMPENSRKRFIHKATWSLLTIVILHVASFTTFFEPERYDEELD